MLKFTPILGLVFNFYVVFSQSEGAMIRVDENLNTIYSIKTDSLPKDYNYVFPEFLRNDSILNFGYQLVKQKQAKEKTIWVKDFMNPLKCHFDSTFLFQRIYVSNVRKFEIGLYSVSEDVWYSKDYKTNHEGYQIPTFMELSEWQESPISGGGEGKFLSMRKLVNELGEIRIIAYPRDPSKTVDFVIGDLKLINFGWIEKEFNHPFFREAFDQEYTQNYNSFSVPPGEPFVLSGLPFYSFGQSNFNGKIYIRNMHHGDTRESILRVLNTALKKYPFYEEKGIIRDQMLVDFDLLVDQQLSLEQLWDSLQIMINKLYDPHFLLYDRYHKRSPVIPKTPIRFFELNGAVHIAAVFDRFLNDLGVLGAKVIEYNGKPLEHIVDSISRQNLGKLSVRRNKAIHQLHRVPFGDTILLKVKREKGDTLEFKLHNVDKISIPKGFKILRNGDFKMFENNVAYLKINSWQPSSYITFYNQINELKKAKALILDLRDNPGGWSSIAAKIASVFIKAPMVYSHSAYMWNDYNTSIESNIVSPHSQYYLGNLNLILLVNSRTACASEVFTNFLQKNTEALVIGTTRTAGTNANVYSVEFANSYQMKLNSLGKEYLVRFSTIEDEGLVPDVWVSFESIYDLAPYNDKLLKSALKILSKHAD